MEGRKLDAVIFHLKIKGMKRHTQSKKEKCISWNEDGRPTTSGRPPCCPPWHPPLQLEGKAQ
jgi:hypothetical protein